ncbi:type I methionyl aminopeptidase [Pseudonocardia asaccharolytica]|uniref:Methionine aminopeptidase n=1 Tax=Pseudonocardia asaccharolytica DSM 44247 = NBRC 16224 TaxID=1123024 RepID=A0A511CY71_9PSEU|nr:type I methionyl aminopeptidase [Pseudonocardia asaccharolytica]GEL17501.1 methionine aminopeptidase [Pseudonocardia asaccharolytica DSM 44247 = NBRC 16224]
MIELKTPGELDAMAAAGRVVARTLAALRDHARHGMRLRELNELAAGLIREAGAKPTFLGYHPRFAPTPYPAVICASRNDAVVHGIPGRERLGLGDLLSIDLAVHLDGWCADSAISFVVGGNGDAAKVDLALIDATERALQAGIDAARPGRRLGDVGAAISAVARGAGFGMLAGHGGHGIGRAMHEAPHVPNEGCPGHGLLLRPGLTFAIEPMLIAGGVDDYRHDPDGWTLRTADGSRAAHAEHTIGIAEDGPRVLTAP